MNQQHPPGWPPGTPPGYPPPHQGQPHYPPQAAGYGPPHGHAAPHGVPYYPQYPHGAAPKPGISIGRILAGVIVGLFMVGGAIYLTLVLLVPGLSGADDARQAGPAGRRPDIGERAAEALRGPQVITDEEIAVGADGWQARSFTAPSSRRVQVTAEGRTHTDKGFTVFVIPASDVEALRRGESVNHLQSFHCPKVRSCNNVGVVPTGSWAVVVKNSENIINTMVVKLRVVADPGI